MDEELYFLTLTTGHTSNSPRAQVGEEVIERLLSVLDNDGAMGNDWTVQHWTEPGFALFRLIVSGMMLTQSVVCYEENASRVAWVAINTSPVIDETGIVPGQTVPTCLPWVVTLMTASMCKLPLHAATRDLMFALGDATRCIGWALIERARRQREH